MRDRSRSCIETLGVSTAIVFLVTAPAVGQSATSGGAAAKPAGATKANTLRTPWGAPDLQGVWNFSTITPLLRPKQFGNREFMTDEEVAKFEEEENRRQNRDLIDPKKGGAQYPPGGVVPYNEFWYDRGNKVIGTKRTSLIVDPPDGRVPPRTPEGERKAAEAASEERDNQTGKPRADSYEQRGLGERCITGFNAGPPMMPSAYNNNMQIVQTANYVVIMTEMVHEARIVPLGGRPHGVVRRPQGDSLGHWEGNTLVVNTTNFLREPRKQMVERFTLVDDGTLMYEYTVNDPEEWTRPWSAQLPMARSAESIYEYACHEGNSGMEGILKGARADDRAASGAPQR